MCIELCDCAQNNNDLGPGTVRARILCAFDKAIDGSDWYYSYILPVRCDRSG